MRASRPATLALLALLAVVAGAAYWTAHWMEKRPLPGTGGLWFPGRFELPVPRFAQADERWGENALASTPSTLAREGCAVASAAMVLAARGIDTDPGRLNQFLTGLDGGFTPEGWIYWEKAAEFDPEKTPSLLPHYEDRPSFFLIDSQLLRGNPVIARVRYPSGITHFVVIAGKRGFDYLVVDPGAGGERGLYPVKEFPSPIEAIRFYKPPGEN